MTWTPSDKPAVTLADSTLEEMSKNERIKVASQGLFFVSDGKTTHTFADELDALTRGEDETIGGEAKELSKFFGIYRQQVRGERGRKTGDHVFMVRIKCPAGGELTAKQWAALDDASEQFADGTIRITSRQGVQYHYVHGAEAGAAGALPEPPLPRRGDAQRLRRREPQRDGVARRRSARARRSARSRAGGDDRRRARAAHRRRTSRSSSPTTTAAPSRRCSSDEPLYGPQYLPRKFKIGIAHPDDNSIDALTQDVGLIPVLVNGKRRFAVGPLLRRRPRPVAQQSADRAAARHVPRPHRARSGGRRGEGDRHRSRRSTASAATASRRAGSTRSGVSVSTAVKKALRRALRDPPRRRARRSRSRPAGCTSASATRSTARSFYGISIENGRVKPPQRKAIREAVETLGLGVRMTRAPGRDADAASAIAPRCSRSSIATGSARPEAVSRARSLGDRVPRAADLRSRDDRTPRTCCRAIRRDRGRRPRRRRPRGAHDGLPEPLRAPAVRRDRHLRLRQERPRAAGGRRAQRHAPRARRSTRASQATRSCPRSSASSAP